MKKIYLILISACILGCANFAFGQSNVSLPAGVQSILNKNYPKWKLVKNFCSTAISGDFNGDGKKDYLAIITYQNGGSLVGFISKGTSFRQIEIEKLKSSVAKTSAVIAARKGNEAVVSGDAGDDDIKVKKLRSDGFYYGTCESDDGWTFIFKNGKFVPVSINNY